VGRQRCRNDHTGKTNTNPTTATTTDITGSPGSSTQRNIKTLNIRNTDASTRTRSPSASMRTAPPTNCLSVRSPHRRCSPTSRVWAGISLPRTVAIRLSLVGCCFMCWRPTTQVARTSTRRSRGFQPRAELQLRRRPRISSRVVFIRHVRRARLRTRPAFCSGARPLSLTSITGEKEKLATPTRSPRPRFLGNRRDITGVESGLDLHDGKLVLPCIWHCAHQRRWYLHPAIYLLCGTGRCADDQAWIVLQDVANRVKHGGVARHLGLMPRWLRQ
jgi:hypothetical protein